MGVPVSYVRHQLPVIGSFLRTAYQVARGSKGGGPVVTPGPTLEATLAPRPAALIADYLRWSGGDPSAWKGRVPPHLFPQWTFALATRTLDGVPYDLTKVVNAGCKMKVRAPIRADQPLFVKTWLGSVDDDGRRAILEQRILTGNVGGPDAIDASLFVFVPLAKREAGGKAKPKPTVPVDARPLVRRKLAANAGFEFALLTGDFNPVHWIPPYARAAGFKSTILHGFGTYALAAEALIRGRLAGDTTRFTGLDVQFTRPLVLPGRATVFVRGDHEVYVGTEAGGPAFLTGSFTHA